MKCGLQKAVIFTLFVLGLNLQAQTLRTATASASTTNGFVVGITVNDGGAGYTFPPSVTITGNGVGAGAHSVISNGVVTQIVVTNAGSGYSLLPSVTISSPSESFSFRSGAAYVTIPDSASLDSTTDQLTVECWYSRASNQGDWNALVSKNGSDPGSFSGYALHFFGNIVHGSIQTIPSVGLEGGLATGNSHPSFPGWHHYAMQYDRTNFSLWIDGAVVFAATLPAQLVLSANPLTIGAQNAGFRAFDGYIDEVRISRAIRYNTTFSPQTRFVSDSNTVALYHFDEGFGSVVNDASGNGNNGIITGSSSWSTNQPVASPSTVNLRKAVYVDFSNLLVGTNYQLQISTDLNGGGWTNFGSAFTATNSAMSLPNYWNVSDWGQLFFRLSQ